LLAARSDFDRVTKSFLIALLATASLLATGCYCPMLSGRYGELDCYPPCPMPPPTAPAKVEDKTATAESCGPHGCCLFGGLFGGRGFTGLGLAHNASQVPSQQGPDYVSPQPKFHPVPTRPVFEPQFAYPPPQPIEVGGSNPLRASRPTGPGLFGGGLFFADSPRLSSRISRVVPDQQPTAAPTPPPDR